jgi:hypothetical protein
VAEGVIEGRVARAPVNILALLREMPVGRPARHRFIPDECADKSDLTAGILCCALDGGALAFHQHVVSDAVSRQVVRTREHDRQPALGRRRCKGLALAFSALAIDGEHVARRRVRDAEEHGEVRPRRCPGRRADGQKRRVDPCLIEGDEEIERAVARPLLMSLGNRSHAVLIVKFRHEIGGTGRERRHSGIAQETRVTRHFDQDVFETAGKAAGTFGLGLAGDDRRGLVEIACRSRRCMRDARRADRDASGKRQGMSDHRAIISGPRRRFKMRAGAAKRGFARSRGMR